MASEMLHRALRKLLAEIFSGDDLRHFLSELDGGHDLVAAMVPRTASDEALFFDAVLKLDQRGEISDEFFRALHAARPKRTALIQEVEHLWSAGSSTAQRPAFQLPKRGAGISRPRALITYRRDSDAHREGVLNFAKRLRMDGVDAWIEERQEFTVQGWIHWAQRQITEDAYILMVYADTHVCPYDGPAGHAGEQRVDEAVVDASRMVMVLFGDREDLPISRVLQAFARYRVPSGYDGLIRHLTGQHFSHTGVATASTPSPSPLPQESVFHRLALDALLDDTRAMVLSVRHGPTMQGLLQKAIHAVGASLQEMNLVLPSCSPRDWMEQLRLRGIKVPAPIQSGVQAALALSVEKSTTGAGIPGRVERCVGALEDLARSLLDQRGSTFVDALFRHHRLHPGPSLAERLIDLIPAVDLRLAAEVADRFADGEIAHRGPRVGEDADLLRWIARKVSLQADPRLTPLRNLGTALLANGVAIEPIRIWLREVDAQGKPGAGEGRSSTEEPWPALRLELEEMPGGELILLAAWLFGREGASIIPLERLARTRPEVLRPFRSPGGVAGVVDGLIDACALVVSRPAGAPGIATSDMLLVLSVPPGNAYDNFAEVSRRPRLLRHLFRGVAIEPRWPEANPRTLAGEHISDPRQEGTSLLIGAPLVAGELSSLVDEKGIRAVFAYPPSVAERASLCRALEEFCLHPCAFHFHVPVQSSTLDLLFPGGGDRSLQDLVGAMRLRTWDATPVTVLLDDTRFKPISLHSIG